MYTYKYTAISDRDNDSGVCYRITCKSSLTGTEAALIRQEILDSIAVGYAVIYLDTKDVAAADLSGINEVIHSAYILRNTATAFILIYRRHSQIDKWVETTGLDKFVKTAIVPAA